MNNLLKRIRLRKGFTLVECIIAIAVFAIMVMLVFMILTNARNEAVNANKAEEDLTKLIDNVVGDETYKKFNSTNYNNLHLEIGGASTGTFDITYNVVDGYKNFVICDYVDPTTGAACNYFADNADFMGNVLPSAFSQTPYICPKCGHNNIIQQLVCEDCGATADHTDSSQFVYMPESGGYGCVECGGTTVRGTNIDDFVDANAKLSVSGLVANAITYGQVEQQTTPDALITCDGATPGQTVSLQLQYEDNASGNNSIAGTYTLELQTVPSNITKVTVRMPPYYKIQNFVNAYPTVPCSTVDGIDYTSDGRPIGQDGYITFNTATQKNGKVTFQLVNYKSGFSFEYDYYDSDHSKAGLSKYWFGMNGSLTVNGTTGYVEDFTCNRSYTVS